MARHNDLGSMGESLAASYLERHGYKVLHKNYRYLKAEIDIIARKGNVLAVVEVKSRTSEDFEPIAGTVGRKKVALLVLAADQYVISRDIDLEIRFDIITVYFQGQHPQLTHIENAFYHF